MKTLIHRAETRGNANLGWLDSRHTFSFSNYHNAERVHFGMLRVLNDDVVAPGMGFGQHPHDNMEIVSIPLKGSLKHKDTTGREEIIQTGDVQIMSAGSGLMHSEMNASPTDEVNFLQIWVFPKERDIAPRYEQKTFYAGGRINNWQVVVSPNKEEGGVWINQDAWFNLAKIESKKSLDYTLHKDTHGVYVFVISGQLNLGDIVLHHRYGMGIEDTTHINIEALEDSEVLLIEVPMH